MPYLLQSDVCEFDRTKILTISLCTRRVLSPVARVKVHAAGIEGAAWTQREIRKEGGSWRAE